MQTTKMYIELIIIGLESSIGLLFTLSSIIGIDKAKILISYFDNASILLILLGIFYIIGIIFDRLADLLFQSIENSCRKKSGLKVKSIMLLPFSNTQYEYVLYSRSRIRIIRATIINSLFAMISSICFISLHINTNRFGLILFSIVFCVFAICVSYISYIKLLKNTYDNARVYEMGL